MCQLILSSDKKSHLNQLMSTEKPLIWWVINRLIHIVHRKTGFNKEFFDIADWFFLVREDLTGGLGG